MSSHILLPQVDAERPATLSRAILQGLLRDELGFDGVIVSDALDMAGASATIGIPEAAVRALDAGCDLLCIGSETTPELVDEMERVVLRAIADGRLAESRVQDAADRIVALAEELTAEREHAPLTAVADTDDLLDDDIERVIAAFDVRDRASSILGDRRTALRLVRIETGTNVAVGMAPWGPDADASAPDRNGGPVWTDSTTVAPGSRVSLEPDADSIVVAVGRDIHRHPFAREVVDGLRDTHPAVLSVDMGWPSDDRAYADIATFGGSRLVGQALTNYLAGWAE